MTVSKTDHWGGKRASFHTRRMQKPEETGKFCLWKEPMNVFSTLFMNSTTSSGICSFNCAMPDLIRSHGMNARAVTMRTLCANSN